MSAEGVLPDNGQWVMLRQGESSLWVEHMGLADVTYVDDAELRRVSDELLAANPPPPWEEVCSHLFGRIYRVGQWPDMWQVVARVIGVADPRSLLLPSKSEDRQTISCWEFLRELDEWPDQAFYAYWGRPSPEELERYSTTIWATGDVPELRRK